MGAEKKAESSPSPQATPPTPNSPQSSAPGGLPWGQL